MGWGLTGFSMRVFAPPIPSVSYNRQYGPCNRQSFLRRLQCFVVTLLLTLWRYANANSILELLPLALQLPSILEVTTEFCPHKTSALISGSKYLLVRAYYLLFSLQLICALILQSVLYVIAVLCSNRPPQTTPTPRFAGLQTVIVREALFGVPEQFGKGDFTGKSPNIPPLPPYHNRRPQPPTVITEKNFGLVGLFPTQPWMTQLSPLYTHAPKRALVFGLHSQ